MGEQAKWVNHRIIFVQTWNIVNKTLLKNIYEMGVFKLPCLWNSLCQWLNFTLTDIQRWLISREAYLLSPRTHKWQDKQCVTVTLENNQWKVTEVGDMSALIQIYCINKANMESKKQNDDIMGIKCTWIKISSETEGCAVPAILAVFHLFPTLCPSSLLLRFPRKETEHLLLCAVVQSLPCTKAH